MDELTRVIIYLHDIRDTFQKIALAAWQVN